MAECYDASRQQHRGRAVELAEYGNSAYEHGQQAKSLAYKSENLRWRQNYNTQDYYLGQCVRDALLVDILMKNDSIRKGRIESFDNWSLLVSYEGRQCLLFKSGVMAITVAERDTIVASDYFTAEKLSDFGSEYAHNPS